MLLCSLRLENVSKKKPQSCMSAEGFVDRTPLRLRGLCRLAPFSLGGTKNLVSTQSRVCRWSRPSGNADAAQQSPRRPHNSNGGAGRRVVQHPDTVNRCGRYRPFLNAAPSIQATLSGRRMREALQSPTTASLSRRQGSARWGASLMDRAGTSRKQLRRYSSRSTRSTRRSRQAGRQRRDI